MEKSVTITFDRKTGQAEVDLQGFHGKGCKAVAKAFAEAIGTTVSSTDKPEMFHTANTNIVVNR